MFRPIPRNNNNQQKTTNSRRARLASRSRRRGRPSCLETARPLPTPHRPVFGSHLSLSLRAALRAAPPVDLRDGWTCTQVRIDGDGAVATLLDARNGALVTVNARYVAGCDGAQSVVRAGADIGLEGL